jgi:hypothetical protein
LVVMAVVVAVAVTMVACLLWSFYYDQFLADFDGNERTNC